MLRFLVPVSQPSNVDTLSRQPKIAPLPTAHVRWAAGVIEHRVLCFCPPSLNNHSGGVGFLVAINSPSPQRSEVEAIKVRHLGPHSHEVFHKLLLRVRARINFRECSELRVRTEDQIDTGAGPLDLIRLPISPLVHAFRASGRLPLRAHVDTVDEEVVRQSLGSAAIAGDGSKSSP